MRHRFSGVVLPLTAGIAIWAGGVSLAAAQDMRIAQSEDPFKKSYEGSSDSGDDGNDYGFGGEGQSPGVDTEDGSRPEDGDSSASGQEPSGPTTDEEMGYGENKSGRTVVVYTRDASGRVIRSTHIHYDAQGNEIGRDVYNVDPDEPQPPADSTGVPDVDDDEAGPAGQVGDDQTPSETAGDLDGTYTGQLRGDASAELTLVVRGNTVSGQVEGGMYEGDPFGGVTFTAQIDENGRFKAGVSRTIPAEDEDDPPTVVTATIEGQFTGGTASGTWRASSGLASADGDWWAN